MYFYSAKKGEKHDELLTEYPGVYIKNVYIDGKEWKDFDPETGYINLPKGTNLKVKVVYLSK